MRLFTHRIEQGKGLAPVLLKRSAKVVLTWDVRQKSRFQATDSNGQALAVSLARGSVIRGGDVLIGEGNELLTVYAADQTLMKVQACPEHGNDFDLMRAAYHLGNRHVSLALTPEALYLEDDPVLKDMLIRMHLIVTTIQAPFEPESGAYFLATAHGHSHEHSGHAHGHHGDHSHHEHD